MDEVENYNHPALFYLAKSINAMGKVDAVYFTKDWFMARGCKIEREIAKAYGVKILDYDLLEEPKEELVRTPVEPIIMPCDFKTPIPEQPYKITCDNAVAGKHKENGEFDMRTHYPIKKKFGPIDPLDPLSRCYEDIEEDEKNG